MAKISRLTIRKYMGDDAYSWAVFLDGYPVATGCSRPEADYHKRAIAELKGITLPAKRVR